LGADKQRPNFAEEAVDASTMSKIKEKAMEFPLQQNPSNRPASAYVLVRAVAPCNNRGQERLFSHRAK